MRHVGMWQYRAARAGLAPLLVAAFLAAGTAMAPAVSLDHEDALRTTWATPPLGLSPAPGASTGPRAATPATTTSRPPTAYRADLAKAIAADGGAGTVSVAAINLATGASFAGGSTRGQWIASAYKLLLVEALLLKQHGALSDSERNDAALAIEHSDNAAGYRLYDDVGGQWGMMQQLRRLGVQHFHPGMYDPTFSTTSAADLVQVLRALVDPRPLSAPSRDFALDLLRQVELDQRWGVGAAATDGDFVAKNGWLSIDNDNPPGETDGGLWAVNSMGIVDVRGQKLLIAVMTQHNDDYADGIHRVETLAKLLARVVAP